MHDVTKDYISEGYTLSTLIARLQYLQAVHGDLPVYAYTGCNSCGGAGSAIANEVHFTLQRDARYNSPARPNRITIAGDDE